MEDVAVFYKVLIKDFAEYGTEDGIKNDISWVQEGHDCSESRDIRLT